MDIRKLVYKELISVALNRSIDSIQSSIGYTHKDATNDVLHRFDLFINMFCKKYPKEAHIIRQSARLYREDLEAL